MATQEDLEVEMIILPGNDPRRSNRRQNHRREGDLESIKIGGKVDKGREVTVYCGAAPKRKEKTTFSWLEEFTMEWSETFILRNPKTTRKENK